MTKLRFLLTGLVGVCATMMFSQTLPSTLPSTGSRYYGVSSTSSAGETWLFQIAGKHYRAKISLPEVTAGPDWRPSMPLPLSLAKAEEIARAELRKLGVDDWGWDITDLHLKRLRGSNQPQWYFIVGLAPVPVVGNTAAPGDSFFAVISLSGKAGLIQLDPTPR